MLTKLSATVALHCFCLGGSGTTLPLSPLCFQPPGSLCLLQMPASSQMIPLAHSVCAASPAFPFLSFPFLCLLLGHESQSSDSGWFWDHRPEVEKGCFPFQESHFAFVFGSLHLSMKMKSLMTTSWQSRMGREKVNAASKLAQSTKEF